MIAAFPLALAIVGICCVATIFVLILIKGGQSDL